MGTFEGIFHRKENENSIYKIEKRITLDDFCRLFSHPDKAVSLIDSHSDKDGNIITKHSYISREKLMKIIVVSLEKKQESIQEDRESIGLKRVSQDKLPHKISIEQLDAFLEGIRVSEETLDEKKLLEMVQTMMVHPLFVAHIGSDGNRQKFRSISRLANE